MDAPVPGGNAAADTGRVEFVAGVDRPKHLERRLDRRRRRHRAREAIRLETFAYGFCFAHSMAVMRDALGK